MLFNYILEFRGGTYVTQVKADSLIDSVSAWVLQMEMEISEIKFIGIKTINQIKGKITKGEIDDPTPLAGLKNVWYNGISVSMGYLSFNIVMTTP